MTVLKKRYESSQKKIRWKFRKRWLATD